MSGSPEAQLIVFCGLPGVGKTALSRRVADALHATFLRVDTIEAAIVSTFMPFEHNPVGYVVAGEIAADQLRAGRTVVADAVNSLQVARDGWAEVAERCRVPRRFVEIICSDAAEHRRRVRTRSAEMPGHGVPTWEQVRRRRWEPITGSRLVVDNIGEPGAHVSAIVAWLAMTDG
ncbi:MAG: AAA family ATPase [Jatrophihabitantaceae bacterium]